MSHGPHTTSLFELVGLPPRSIAITRFGVTRTDGGTLTTRRLGEAAFALGRSLGSAAQVRGGDVCALGNFDERGPLVLTRGKAGYRLAPTGVMHVRVEDPSWAEALRRLASEELKRHLVYETQQTWYRQRCFFGHNIRRDPESQLAYCEGMKIELVSLPDGRLAAALDRHIARLGPPLDEKAPRDRLQYILDDPYAGDLSAEGGDDDAVEIPRMARNYVLSERGRLRRVWIDVKATREAEADSIYVRTNRDDESFPVDPADLRPVLAPDEVPGRAGEAHGTAGPQYRSHRAKKFAKEFLQDLPLLGARLSASAEPLSGAALSIGWFEPPTLSVGEPPGGGGAEFAPPRDLRDLPEHRVKALETYGLRFRPPALRRVGIVALEGEEALATQLAEDCNALFRRWQMSDVLGATVLPPKVAGNRRLRPAERLRAARSWIEEAAESERPQALFVYKELGSQGDESDPMYREIHQELGGRLGIPTKPLQARRQGKGDSATIIVLAGLLSRAGAVLWGLGGSAERPGLVHDLVFALDVGGRARTSPDGNDRAGFCALAGDHRPALWCKGTPVTRETVPARLLEDWALGAARELRGSYVGNWLFMRDGQIPDQEWAALRAVAAKARAEGLLAEDRCFTAVEVHKDHPIRIFGCERDQAGQPVTGAHFWLQEASSDQGVRSEAALVTTGRPWNLKGTAEPLRVFIRTIAGENRHRDALCDMWRMTHLTWHVPRHEISLPLPLYAADRVCQRQAERRPLYANPC